MFYNFSIVGDVSFDVKNIPLQRQDTREAVRAGTTTERADYATFQFDGQRVRIFEARVRVKRTIDEGIWCVKWSMCSLRIRVRFRVRRELQ